MTETTRQGQLYAPGRVFTKPARRNGFGRRICRRAVLRQNRATTLGGALAIASGLLLRPRRG